MTRGMSGTDRINAPWPHSAPLVSAVRRAAAGIATPVCAWYARLRAHSSSLWISEQWLAEHERHASKHEESI